MSLVPRESRPAYAIGGVPVVGIVAIAATIAAIATIAMLATPASVEAQSGGGAPARSKGIEALEQEAREAPGEVDRQLRLARAYEKAGRQADAVASFRRALALDASSLEARQALERLGDIGWSEGEVLVRADEMLAQGRLREAAYLYERFLKDHPESERARRGLARSRPATAPTPASSSTAVQPPAATTPEPERALPAPPPAAVPPPPRATTEAAAIPIAREVRPASPARSPIATAVPAPVQVETRAKEALPGAAPASSSGIGLRAALTLGAGALLAAVVVFVLRRRRQIHATMSGDLAMMSLPDVLQFLGLGAKTGVLEVSSTAGDATILLTAGRIRGVVQDGSSGASALYRTLAWRDGSFRFLEQALPADRGEPLDLPVQEALLEWAAREDVAHRESEVAAPASLLDQIDDDTLNRQLPF